MNNREEKRIEKRKSRTIKKKFESGIKDREDFFLFLFSMEIDVIDRAAETRLVAFPQGPLRIINKTHYKQLMFCMYICTYSS